jgi:hypothetical protein
MEFLKYASKQEYDNYKRFLTERFTVNMSYGCISSCICPNCYAVFTDGICCCGAASGFLCSKCGVDSTLKSRLSTSFVNLQQMADIKNFGTDEEKPLDNRS